jgi:hypothetical protein
VDGDWHLHRHRRAAVRVGGLDGAEPPDLTSAFEGDELAAGSWGAH